jgi:hypothetical protein
VQVTVSTYQMCVLLLFNERTNISYADIAAATHIPTADLKRALQSLACAKFKILNKASAARHSDACSREQPTPAWVVREPAWVVCAALRFLSTARTTHAGSRICAHARVARCLAPPCLLSPSPSSVALCPPTLPAA